MVEYRFDPKSPVIVLYARLSNSQTRRITLALDTGATYTMIPWDIAEALGYEPALSKKKAVITTASGVEKAPLITIDSISVLGKEARDVECIVHDLPEVSRVDGLLGLSFLRRFKVCLDFKEGIMEID
jgi:clan AA aspartic protease (TIGR02281 family)